MKRSFLLLSLAAMAVSAASAADKKMVLMLAGTPSHPPGAHEHNAGTLLLAKCLAEGAGETVETKIHLNGEWPTAEELAQADSIVLYADGGPKHPFIQEDHLQQLEGPMKRGCGLVCLHFAVEVQKNQGGPEFLRWLGGYFEANWSVNPHWMPDFTSLPSHPITSGVKPFSTEDEWYFHMRFREGMQGVTPILTAIPPDSTMERKDDSHSGNPAVRAEVAAKVPQHVSWAAEREGGGRAFGFTGGHFHEGWANEEQRRLVLNAIVWTAHGLVPAGGITSKVTPEELKMNLDLKPLNPFPKKKAEGKPGPTSEPRPIPAAGSPPPAVP